jgi:hypothetical protein
MKDTSPSSSMRTRHREDKRALPTMAQLTLLQTGANLENRNGCLRPGIDRRMMCPHQLNRLPASTTHPETVWHITGYATVAGCHHHQG